MDTPAENSANQPDSKGHVHVIGIGGVGMSATAVLLKDAGYEVTGSDAEVYGPPRDTLEQAGITPNLGYSPDNIPPDTDQFVIGRSAKLVREDNPEVEAAYQTGKPISNFPEMLGALTLGRENVVVAGSYGKSSTSALLAFILRHAGVDAGYFVGAQSFSLPQPASFGTDPVFVLEGDEYPSGHTDPQSKFLHLHPRDILLTSVVHDHVNVFPTFEEYQKPFRELLSMIAENGLIVASADEPGALALATESEKNLVTYGLHAGKFQASDIHVGERTRFTLTEDGQSVVQIETSLLGHHNIENIVGASAYLLSRGLVSPDALKAAVADFKGVRRRLDLLTPDSSIPTFEGFGSSYEKARAAIAAIRLHFPSRRFAVVFEPHTFGWRNRANLAWYDDVFEGAATVFVAPPETQGAATHDQLSGEEIVVRLQSNGTPVHTYDPAHPELTVSQLQPGDVVLILTSGDLEGSLPQLIRMITEQFPK